MPQANPGLGDAIPLGLVGVWGGGREVRSGKGEWLVGEAGDEGWGRTDRANRSDRTDGAILSQWSGM